MKRSITLAALLVACFGSRSADAQESPVPSPAPIATATPAAAVKPMVGLGISYGGASAVLVGATSLRVPRGPMMILVPIRSGKIRIEPQIGFDQYSTEIDEGFATLESTLTQVRLAVGVQTIVTSTETTSLYVGPRLGVDSLNFSDEYDGESEKFRRLDYLLSVVAGGEHFFSDHFSFGAEAVLDFTVIGGRYTDSFEDTQDTSGQLISTQGLLTFRWYY